MSVARPPQRASFFDRVGEILSRAGFGVLYLLNKSESADASKGVLDFSLFVLSFAQLASFPLNPVLWPKGRFLPDVAMAFDAFALADVLRKRVTTSIALIVFFAALTWLALLLASVGYAGYAFVQARFRIMTPLKFLRLTARVSTTALLIPLTNVVASVWRCENDATGTARWTPAGWQCYRGPHLAWSVIAAIVLPAFWVLTVVIAAVFVPRSSSHPLTAAHGRLAVARTVIGIVLAIAFNLTGRTPSETQQWLLRVIVVIAAAVLTATHTLLLPYRRERTNKIHGALAAAFVWLSAITAIVPFLKTSDGTEAVMVVGLPLAAALGWYLVALRTDYLASSPVKNLAAFPMVVEAKACLLQAALERSLADARAAAPEGAIGRGAGGRRGSGGADGSGRGRRARHASDIAIGGLGGDGAGGRAGADGGDSDDGGSGSLEAHPCFADVEALYQAALKANPKGAVVHVFYAQYLQRHGVGSDATRQRETQQLMAAEQCGALVPPDFRFLLWQRRRQLHDQELGVGVGESAAPTAATRNQNVVQLSVLNRVTLERALNEALINAVRARSFLVSFWAVLSARVPNLDQLHTSGALFTESVQKAEEAFTQVMSLNPNDITILRRYAAFCGEVLNNAAKQQQLLDEAESKENARSQVPRARTVMSCLLLASPPGSVVDASDPSTLVFVLQVDPRSKLPVIADVSASVSTVLGYAPRQVMGMPVSALAAKPTNPLVLSLTHAAAAGERVPLFDAPSILLWQHREGHLLPLLASFRSFSRGLVLVLQPIALSTNEGVVTFRISDGASAAPFATSITRVGGPFGGSSTLGNTTMLGTGMPPGAGRRASLVLSTIDDAGEEDASVASASVGGASRLMGMSIRAPHDSPRVAIEPLAWCRSSQSQFNDGDSGITLGGFTDLAARAFELSRQAASVQQQYQSDGTSKGALALATTGLARMMDGVGDGSAPSQRGSWGYVFAEPAATRSFLSPVAGATVTVQSPGGAGGFGGKLGESLPSSPVAGATGIPISPGMSTGITRSGKSRLQWDTRLQVAVCSDAYLAAHSVSGAVVGGGKATTVSTSAAGGVAAEESRRSARGDGGKSVADVAAKATFAYAANASPVSTPGAGSAASAATGIESGDNDSSDSASTSASEVGGDSASARDGRMRSPILQRGQLLSTVKSPAAQRPQTSHRGADDRISHAAAARPGGDSFFVLFWKAIVAPAGAAGGPPPPPIRAQPSHGTRLATGSVAAFDVSATVATAASTSGPLVSQRRPTMASNPSAGAAGSARQFPGTSAPAQQLVQLPPLPGAVVPSSASPAQPLRPSVDGSAVTASSGELDGGARRPRQLTEPGDASCSIAGAARFLMEAPLTADPMPHVKNQALSSRTPSSVGTSSSVQTEGGHVELVSGGGTGGGGGGGGGPLGGSSFPTAEAAAGAGMPIPHTVKLVDDGGSFVEAISRLSRTASQGALLPLPAVAFTGHASTGRHVLPSPPSIFMPHGAIGGLRIVAPTDPRLVPSQREWSQRSKGDAEAGADASAANGAPGTPEAGPAPPLALSPMQAPPRALHRSSITARGSGADAPPYSSNPHTSYSGAVVTAEREAMSASRHDLRVTTSHLYAGGAASSPHTDGVSSHSSNTDRSKTLTALRKALELDSARELVDPAVAALRWVFLIVFALVVIVSVLNQGFHIAFSNQYTAAVALQRSSGDLMIAYNAVQQDILHLALMDGGLAPAVAVDNTTLADLSRPIAAGQAQQLLRMMTATPDGQQLPRSLATAPITTLLGTDLYFLQGRDAVAAHAAALRDDIRALVAAVYTDSTSLFGERVHGTLFEDASAVGLARVTYFAPPASAANRTVDVSALAYRASTVGAFTELMATLDQALALPALYPKLPPVAWLLLNEESIAAAMSSIVDASRQEAAAAFDRLFAVSSAVLLGICVAFDLVVMGGISPTVQAVEERKDQILRAFLLLPTKAVTALHNTAESNLRRAGMDIRADGDTDDSDESGEDVALMVAGGTGNPRGFDDDEGADDPILISSRGTPTPFGRPFGKGRNSRVAPAPVAGATARGSSSSREGGGAALPDVPAPFRTNQSDLDGRHRKFVKSSRQFFLLLLRFGGPVFLVVAFMSAAFGFEVVALGSFRWAHFYLSAGTHRASAAQRMWTNLQYAGLGGGPDSLVASDLHTSYAVSESYPSLTRKLRAAIGTGRCVDSESAVMRSLFETDRYFPQTGDHSLWCTTPAAAAFSQASGLLTGNTQLLFGDPDQLEAVNYGSVAPGELIAGALPGFSTTQTQMAGAQAVASGGTTQSNRLLRLPEVLARIDASKDLFLGDGCPFPDATPSCASFSGGLLGNGLVSGVQTYATAVQDTASLLNASATAIPSDYVYSSYQRAASMNCSTGVASGRAGSWQIDTACAGWTTLQATQIGVLARTLLPQALVHAVDIHTEMVRVVPDSFLSTNLALCATTAVGTLLFYLFAYLPMLAAVNVDLKRTMRMLLMLPADLVHSSPALRALLQDFAKRLEQNARSAGASATSVGATGGSGTM